MTPEHVEEFFGASEGACGLWHAAAELQAATLGATVSLLNAKLIKKALEPIEAREHALRLLDLAGLGVPRRAAGALLAAGQDCQLAQGLRFIVLAAFYFS